MQIEIRPTPVFKDDIKGRVTKPSVGMYAAGFQWTPACKTDLRATFAKAREAMKVGER
jgi:hypothetical protein